MKTKSFNIVTNLSLAVTIMAVVFATIALFMSSIYPGFIILLLLMLVPITSKIYANKSGSTTFLTILNVLVTLVALWMTYVIVHDRVLQDCC